MANMIEQGVNIVVALTVGVIMVAFVLTVGINELVAVDTSSWSTGAQSLYDILDLIALLVVFLAFIGWAVSTYKKGS